jgi:uncharacterized protein (TIGR02444 family)
VASDESLWDFAGRLYAAHDVREACLALQERHGADINLLLWAAWAATVRGRALTETEFSAARAAIGSFQDDVLVPLRAARKALKGQPGIGSLYERVKAIELELERVELDRLALVALGDRPGGARDADGALGANLALAAPGAPETALEKLRRSLSRALPGAQER